MGQSASNTGAVTGTHQNQGSGSTKFRFTSSSAGPVPADPPMKDEAVDSVDEVICENYGFDNTYILPDECLALIFQSLSSGDRKRCSLVCQRWLQIEAQSRHRLSLDAQSDLSLAIPSLFSRFESVTKLALKCDRRSVSIGDDALVSISLKCRNLTRLKLRSCCQLTDAGMAEFSKNCKNLKKFSCGSCTFGADGMNALLENCSLLEELSIKRLRGITDAGQLIGAGLASSSLKVICLKALYNAQCFAPLIIGSKNLRTLKLFRCSGDWDNLLEGIADQVNGLIHVHLERLQVSDVGLTALAKCSTLEILHLVKTPECTDIGLTTVAENCKLIRKLHIDGWKTNRIGDEGLIAVAKNCINLQELVLIAVNPSMMSLEKFGTNCLGLERLALCGSETVGDPELSCIAEKCVALRKLCIKNCPVSDQGMEALASGCPNLVKVKVKKCKLVTPEAADWLRASRGLGLLTVNLDTVEVEALDASASDSGVDMQNNGINLASGSTRRSSSFKSRLGFFSGRNWVACTFRTWPGFGGNSRNN